MLQMTTGNRTHAKSKRGSDLYETPYVGTRALVQRHANDLYGRKVWEPCAGPGAMVRELRANGLDVTASDIGRFRRETEPGIRYGTDFLAETRMPDGCNVIVSNPPFMHAEEFLAHALELSETVYFLMRVGFMSGLRWTSAKYDFARHLDRVSIFAPRLPMMHRDGWRGPKNENSAIDLAWYRFERNIATKGPVLREPVIEWLDWRRVATADELAELKERRRKAAQLAKKRKARGDVVSRLEAAKAAAQREERASRVGHL